MEFPNLGDHCYIKTCNRLDFLPIKCDFCSNIFCKDHFHYAYHDCLNSYQRDIQVPVCPLCNKPVPSKRGEQPDIAVGEHIDRVCQSDPAISKRKIYTNKCNVEGCKQKEFIRINCNTCLKNYCLKHRHPFDHKCQKPVTPSQASGAAVMSRDQNKYKIKFPWQSNQSCASNVKRRPVPTPLPEVPVTSVQGKFSEDEALALAQQNSMTETKPRAAVMSRAQNKYKIKFPWQSNQSCASNVNRRPVPTPLPEVPVTSVQGRFSEDEALAHALQNSMTETKPRNVQEKEDRLLALALTDSETERVDTSRSQRNRKRNCCSIS